MSSPNFFTTGRGNGGRSSHHPPVAAANFQVQAESKSFQLPHYPFQPLPKPNGPAPYRFDLSQLLSADDVAKIKGAGVLVCHTFGDTGDYRGQQQDFVAAMMTQDAQSLSGGRKPAFFYHLGDVVYFAGVIDKYGANFYETYKDYPGFIVAIPGNHDCQPDDPQDGPVDPHKKPFDGWVQNFMAPDPGTLGSMKTSSGRTQMDLPNVFWTFTTPFATIIGLCSKHCCPAKLFWRRITQSESVSYGEIIIFRFEKFFDVPDAFGAFSPPNGLLGTMRGEHWPDRFLSTHGAPSPIRVPEMRRPLSRRRATKRLFMLGSVSGDEFRPTDLP